MGGCCSWIITAACSENRHIQFDQIIELAGAKSRATCGMRPAGGALHGRSRRGRLCPVSPYGRAASQPSAVLVNRAAVLPSTKTWMAFSV